MDRKTARKLLPIIKAFGEGKTVQYKRKGGNEWNTIDREDARMIFDITENDYRIKPTYRPFKDEEECWKEMLKHQPFGWVKFIDESKRTVYVNITDLWRSTIYSSDEKDGLSYNDAFKQYTFADGSAFGKLEE